MRKNEKKGKQKKRSVRPGGSVLEKRERKKMCEKHKKKMRQSRPGENEYVPASNVIGAEHGSVH